MKGDGKEDQILIDAANKEFQRQLMETNLYVHELYKTPVTFTGEIKIGKDGKSRIFAWCDGVLLIDPEAFRKVWRSSQNLRTTERVLELRLAQSKQKRQTSKLPITSQMQNAELVERLHKIYACSKAIRWIRHNNLDLISAWSECPEIHWLRWFVDALELEYKPGENVDDFRSQYNFEEIKTQLIRVSDKTYKEKDL